jgi:hypothetical protein
MMNPVSLAMRPILPPLEPQSPRNPILEWLPHKRRNPFNSKKLLAHVYRWRLIRRGRPLPPPVLITVDPTNVCNFKCAWCNAAYIREHRQGSLSATALHRLADFLPLWGTTA